MPSVAVVPKTQQVDAILPTTNLAANLATESKKSPIRQQFSQFFERAHDSYQNSIKSLSQRLFQKGYFIPHYIVGSVFSEPLTTLIASINQLRGWRSTWQKHGFYEASDPESLKKLEADLRIMAATKPGMKPAIPALFFHSLHATNSIWRAWSNELAQAQRSGDIGCVISLQLPNDMTKRVELANKAIDAITDIYKRVFKLRRQRIDLVGHSKGGYTAHLVAFSKQHIYDPEPIGKKSSQKTNVERRWHNIDARNPKVRKVVSVAAPTWLCCDGQRDGEHWDIYPKDGRFTEEQKRIIEKSHSEIYDIVATQDAISSTSSPLPSKQVFEFKLKHLGSVNDLEVCRKVVSILKG